MYVVLIRRRQTSIIWLVVHFSDILFFGGYFLEVEPRNGNLKTRLLGTRDDTCFKSPNDLNLLCVVFELTDIYCYKVYLIVGVVGADGFWFNGFQILFSKYGTISQTRTKLEIELPIFVQIRYDFGEILQISLCPIRYDFGGILQISLWPNKI